MRAWLKEDTTKKMKLLNRAWLAGFFDGEGYIGIGKCHGKRDNLCNWNLCISNTVKSSLDHCQSITGVGSVTRKRPKSSLKHHKKQWVWQIHSQRNIVSILKQMLPFLNIKSDTARKLLKKWRDVS